MTLEEAQEWLQGKRSWMNMYPSDGSNPAARLLRVAQMDAATTEQAYWMLKAHRDGLDKMEVW